MIVKTIPLGSLGANCYYVCDGVTALLVDPGFYDCTLWDFLQKVEVKPTAILLTHGHFDHICGSFELCKRQDLTIYIGKADKDCLYSSERNLSSFVSGYPTISLDEKTEVIGLLGGEELDIGSFKFKTIALPGHTSGGMGYLTQDMLFCGDTAFCGSIGRTDLPTGNFSVLKESIKKLCKMPDDTVLYCGHGEITTVGREKQHNPYFQPGVL